ncbi:MAG: nuclear transport factor 2 family protein [Solirubrobacteraceae bacterium]
MSQENVELVRRMWEAFLSNDFQTALTSYDPDVEWDGTNLPDGQVGRGLEAIMDHITRWSDMWESWNVEVERVIDAGDDHVVVFIRETGRSSSGLDMDERHGELYTVRAGRIVRRQGFSDPNEALEAVGLRE